MARRIPTYHPLVDLLKNYFQLTNQDDDRRRREKITGKVLTLDRGLEDTLPYLFFLLGLAEPTSPLQQMDGQIRRQRILEAIKRLLLRESLNQPLLIIFEDLHWLDNETQSFLQLLSESLATARILLLVNYRPEYQHQWNGKTYFSQLRLDPLGTEQAEEMLGALLADVGATHASPLRDFILAKTEGNPFFMEEIVQTLKEQQLLTAGTHGHASLPSDLRLPTTVQGVLSARMDRLPAEEKALLQTLAVIGREFAASLLQKIATQPEAELHRLLARLQAAEFVYAQPAFPDVEYIFKHALTQEVAYNSLLIERRKVLHERTAQAMEEVYKDQLEDHYGELAYHYGRSGNAGKAVEYLGLAGQQAVQRSANVEAITHLTSALELLKTLPETPERDQQELTLQLVLGVPLLATKGYSASEVTQAYTRARELSQRMGEGPQLFSALWGLYLSSVVRADFGATRELGEQLFIMAQRMPAFSPFAHYAMGWGFFCQGKLTPAQEQYEQGIALYDLPQHRFYGFHYGQDPGVVCSIFVGLTLYLLGYPEQAQNRTFEALTLAGEIAHPYSLAVALAGDAMLHHMRRESQLAQKQAEATITFSTEHGFPFSIAWGTILRGWALTKQGQGEQGIAQMRHGVDGWRATGAEVWRPYFLALLAEAQGKLDRTEEGLNILAEALALANETEERWNEAELYRLKGELTLQSKASLGQVEAQSQTSRSPSEVEQETEECFLKAIEVAQKQQAKSLELRAVMSLARLWQQQGKATAAHQMLSAIYNWFTEGFDTKDLQEAKVLLTALEKATT
ncbi:MAG: AAA family ATPase [Candidatus Binatia bacterium]